MSSVSQGTSHPIFFILFGSFYDNSLKWEGRRRNSSIELVQSVCHMSEWLWSNDPSSLVIFFPLTFGMWDTFHADILWMLGVCPKIPKVWVRNDRLEVSPSLYELESISNELESISSWADSSDRGRVISCDSDKPNSPKFTAYINKSKCLHHYVICS